MSRRSGRYWAAPVRVMDGDAALDKELVDTMLANAQKAVSRPLIHVAVGEAEMEMPLSVKLMASLESRN